MRAVGSIAQLITDAQHTAKRPITMLEGGDGLDFDYIQAELERLLDFNTVELVTATNVAEEKEKWLTWARGGRFTNPNFTYNLDLAHEIAEKREALLKLYKNTEFIYRDAINEVEKLRARLLLGRISSALGAVYLASGILNKDDREALGGSVMRYCRLKTQGIGWPDILEWAEIGVEDLKSKRVITDTQILTSAQESRLRKLMLDARGIAEWFQWAVDEYGFNYSVEIDTAATAIDVRETSEVGYPRIVIPASRRMHALKLVTLIRHEIDCHARDSHNGQKLLWGLGGGALRAEDDVVSEGHAMTEENAFLRYCTGESPRQALPWYALAIAQAQQRKPFARVAQRNYELRVSCGTDKKTALKNAWNTTYRVFRGSSDTHNPDGYAFWKDKAYLQGTMEVGDLYEAGLSHWAALGSFELDELVAIAHVVRVRPEDLPYQDLNTAKQVAEKLS